MAYFLFMLLFIDSPTAGFSDSDQLMQDLKLMEEKVGNTWETLENIQQKIKKLARDARVTGIKSTKTVSQLKKSTDVAIYEMFNNEIVRKHRLAESLFKSSVKNLKEGSVPKRIEKIIDFYVKRQQVPDPEMHVYLVQLERKIGELASHVRKTFNIDKVNMALISLAVLLGLVWQNVGVVRKTHEM